MKKEKLFELNILANLMNISMYYYAADSNEILFTIPEYIKREYIDLSYIKQIKKKLSENNIPLIYKKFDDIYIGVIPFQNNDYLLVGPISTSKLDFSQKWKYLHAHKMNKWEDIIMPQMEFYSFIELLILVTHMLTGQSFNYEQIIEYNDIPENVKDKKKKINEEEERAFHHTYEAERIFIEALGEGDGEKAKEQFRNIIGTEGQMSQNAKNHQKYFCISMTTLITRVAMENGILPVIAYKTSDKLINKIDLCKSDEEFYAIYMEIIMTFADMIREAKGKKKYSGYVEQCKYYMEQNYNKKMTLEMLAEYTGLNASYLSHIFPKFEGITINEYMNKIRIERAQNLLKYSDRSIIEISDYTGFQSQSYFGKKFKKYTGMTAAEYRTRYKIKEFREEKV